MRIIKSISVLLTASILLTLTSCRMASSILHDDDVVAVAGKHRLYRAEIESVIPRGVSPEDSLSIASQYINKWAADWIFDEAANRSLPKEDLDLSAELEQYRRVLLKYRYEQRFVNERLDTLVSDSEVATYYEKNKSRYKLSFPIVKVRYVKIHPKSREFPKIKKLLVSDEEADLEHLHELVALAAVKYDDFADRWIDIRELAEELDIDYGTLLSLRSDNVIQYPEDDNTICYIQVRSFMRAGQIPPVEYCSESIREAIVNVRKQELVVKLEQDLLETARSNGSLIIY